MGNQKGVGTPMDATIIIPSLEPTDRFPELIFSLRRLTSQPIIVIDDGSSSAYQILFQQIEAQNVMVYHHPKNLGKGAALKKAFRLQIDHYPDSIGVVTADSDGQHSPRDIIKIAQELKKQSDTLILGTRDFTESSVPFKSYWGNRITSLIFYLATGIHCSDTQTGLRGIPQKWLTFMLQISGDRFDYEMNMLLNVKNYGFTIKEKPIQTIYLDNNDHSHFRPIKDSLLIYRPIFFYIFSSALSAVVDISLFALFSNFLWSTTNTNLFYATVAARFCSGIFNFCLNKKWVFQSNGKTLNEGIKYASLFCIQLFCSWFFLQLLARIFDHIIFLKIIIDTSLFFISFVIQRKLIFTFHSKV